MKTFAILPLVAAAALGLAACSSESTNVTTTENVTDLNGFDDNLATTDEAFDNSANVSELGNETANSN